MMKQGTLGSNGPPVSALRVRSTGMSAADGPADDAESIVTIDRAIGADNTVFVTAEVHGAFATELPLGRASPGPRVNAVVATKLKSADAPTAATCHASAISLRDYLKDVSIAARAFGQALFASRGKADGRRELSWLAREQEAISPASAAELRSIAARA